MVKITSKVVGDRIELSFSGHANYAAYGKDIVCAGVSALYYALCCSLARVPNCDSKVNGTTISVDKNSAHAKIIINCILSGIKNMQHNYPDFVSLIAPSRLGYTPCMDTNLNDPSSKVSQKKTRGKDRAQTIYIDALKLFSERENSARATEFSDGAKSPELTNGDIELSQDNLEQKREENPFKVFKTKQEYQENIDGIIGKRLKENRETVSRLEKLSPIIEKLMQFLGAENEDEFLQNLDAALDSDFEEDIDSGEDYDLFVAAITKEIDDLSQSDNKLYSDTNAESLIGDPRFVDLIANGWSVKDAFSALNLDRVIDSKTSALIRKNRPSENALTSSMGARIAKNVDRMGKSEVEDIIKRVLHGEKIKL